MDKYEEIYATPGAFSWTELMTADPKASIAFYGQLLGWNFDTVDMGQGDYHVIKAGGTAVGGMMGHLPGQAGAPTMWSSYVTVSDADATATQCAALGGKVLAGPMDIPTVGRFAVLQDPMGAVFNVMAYKPS